MSKTGKRDIDISEFFTAPALDDNVNSPAHYTRGGVEIIDCIDAAVAGYSGHASYCAGNVVKYISRAPFKGATAEDLRKAQWYLSRLIAEISK